MDANDATVKTLLAENEAFRKLYQAHLEYETQLATLDRMSYLTPDQEMRRKQIQKLKLNGKDQMAAIMRTHRGA